MRFHVVGLPHTRTSLEFFPCAYTQKVLGFCRMMRDLGHNVVHYGAEKSQPEGEHVTILSADRQQRFFDMKSWRIGGFFPLAYDPNLEYWREFNGNAVREIAKRIKPQDFICVINGNCNAEIADAFPGHQTVEFGIGYEGIFSNYCVFESYAWMHHVYGKRNINDGRAFDAVIPNYLDPALFPISREKDKYLLYVGRFISRKGVIVADEVARRLGMQLVIAGQGVDVVGPGILKGSEITLTGSHLHYEGVVDQKRRGELMSRATAVLVPTQYIGPFETVHAEAMMCGTPVITTDWGVFTETVHDGINGFRCRTLSDFVESVDGCKNLDTQAIRKYAENTFSLNVVAKKYDRYFRRLLTLWRNGWYEIEAA
jgi:glycosyltransferase involved in cell wall biosynthesis